MARDRKRRPPLPAAPPLGSAMSALRAVLALLAALGAPAAAYFVSIDAHAEECFLERVPSGTKMGLIFEVAEGGFLDIDVEVRPGPARAGGALRRGTGTGRAEGAPCGAGRRGAARGLAAWPHSAARWVAAPCKALKAVGEQ